MLCSHLRMQPKPTSKEHKIAFDVVDTFPNAKSCIPSSVSLMTRSTSSTSAGSGDPMSKSKNKSLSHTSLLPSGMMSDAFSESFSFPSDSRVWFSRAGKRSDSDRNLARTCEDQETNNLDESLNHFFLCGRGLRLSFALKIWSLFWHTAFGINWGYCTIVTT